MVVEVMPDHCGLVHVPEECLAGEREEESDERANYRVCTPHNPTGTFP